LFLFIALPINKKQHLALASTCRYLNNYYKQCHEEKTFILLHGLQFVPFIRSHYVKALEHRWGRTDCMHTKIKITKAIVDSQNYDTHPAEALYLNELFKMPDELSYATVHTLILNFSFEITESKLNLSFLEKFSNLNSLRFNNTMFNNNEISILSKLSLLEFISV
jgi:hypothetical protein